MSKRAVILIILDGWGIGREDSTNPLHAANLENINFIKNHYLSGSLQASGIAVGLPWNEEGNSEVGHLTIGAGKTLYQHYPRITLAIQNQEFFKNKAFNDACDHALKNKSAVNLAGVLAEGHVHSSFEHLVALIKLAKDKKVPRLNLHLFSDGKDSPPRSVLKLLEKLSPYLDAVKNTSLASLSGRYFAMDRDRHWDRTQEAYDALLGKKEPVKNIKDYIEFQYSRGLTDEYLAPVMLDSNARPISDNDAVIFFNFREDSMRQIVSPFALPAESLAKGSSKILKIYPLKNLFVATMTQYSDQFQAQVAFAPENIDSPLGKVLADNNKLQLRIAETEKYAHVTYFFNGLKDQPLKNEFRILIPSRNIIRHDEHPEMMAEEIANRIIQAIEEREIDFILANFANADIVAHTGNFEAAMEAVKTIDTQIGKILKAAEAHKAVVIITSDHGNVERMINPITGIIETRHDISPVPIYLIGKEFISKKNPADIRRIENETVGILSDVAPTVLGLMNLPKPPEMTGENLLNRLS